MRGSEYHDRRHNGRAGVLVLAADAGSGVSGRVAPSWLRFGTGGRGRKFQPSRSAELIALEVGRTAGAGPAAKKRRRYAVVGDFDGFPAFTPRPVCQSCAITNLRTLEVAPVTTVTRDMDDEPGDAGVDLRQALDLGRRVDRYLALVAAEDTRAVGLWPELTEADVMLDLGAEDVVGLLAKILAGQDGGVGRVDLSKLAAAGAPDQHVHDIAGAGEQVLAGAGLAREPEGDLEVMANTPRPRGDRPRSSGYRSKRQLS